MAAPLHVMYCRLSDVLAHDPLFILYGSAKIQKILLIPAMSAICLGHLHNHVGLTENFDQSENEEFLVNDSP
jgi:hypothetical protein